MTSDPLNQMASVLDAPMQAVNAEIMRRMESPVDIIPKVASYLIASGGKRIRPLLTIACGALYGADEKKVVNLAAAVEFIHSATLLHDDVVDESAERRGKAAANLVYGNKTSVLVGDFLFSRAFQLMVDAGSMQALKILSDASAIIAQGEVMQLATTNNLAASIDDYIAVVSAKTAALFAAACEVGPVIANAPRDKARAMAEYGMNIGVAFQIADDALDYDAVDEKLGKKTGDDFREGKMTAPVIIALADATEDEKKFWVRTIAKKNQTPEDLTEARAILKRHGAIEKTRAMAHEYAQRARLAMAEGPDHSLRAILDTLADYAVNRDR